MPALNYENALIGRISARVPSPPSVIEAAKNILGRENFRADAGGAYFVWANGRWNGPLKLEGLMRATNEKLKRQGEAQILSNPSWRV